MVYYLNRNGAMLCKALTKADEKGEKATSCLKVTDFPALRDQPVHGVAEPSICFVLYKTSLSFILSQLG